MIQINYEDPDNNMYGCPPCPKCESRFMYPKQPDASGKRFVACDDCGFSDEYVWPTEGEGSS